MLPHSCKIHHFKKAESVVSSLKVVNDCAEWGIALASCFNSSLKISEEDKQYLLQIVERHRKEFPDANKSTAEELTEEKNSAIVNKLVPLCAWLLSGVLEIPRLRLRLSSGTHADSKLVCVLNAEKDVKINNNYIKINAFDF